MLKDGKKCDGCDADLRGAAIPVEHLHFYNHGPDGELIHFAGEYAKVREQIKDETTHFSRVIGVEYPYGVPERHDGVSEWMCPDCGRREGRFSGKVLAEGELERRPR
jgi:hypothetical protein